MKLITTTFALAVISALMAGCGTISYKTSDGTRFAPRDFYPKWSWDTVQEYKMFGDNKLLTDDQVERIAPLSNFIALEKQHGSHDLGFAELGAKHDAARLKAANPDLKVLFYFNGGCSYPATSYNRQLTPKNGGPSEQVKQDLLLFDPKTDEYLEVAGGRYYAFDILKPTFRGWWSETVGRAVKETGTDGVFWDGVDGNVWARRDKRKEIKQAHVTMMQMTSKAMGEGKILLCNNAAHYQEYIENCDAVMYEHYKPERFRKDIQMYVDEWEQMLAVANAGKINVYRMQVDRKGTQFEDADRSVLFSPDNHAELEAIAKERMTFPLACFLIGAQPYSYFMLSWGWGTYTGALVDFPEMKKPLGPPLGPYQRESEDQWIFTRSFEHANVWVDLESQDARITWK